MATAAPTTPLDQVMGVFDGFLKVLDMASGSEVERWNRRTYATAKSWAAQMQTVVTRLLRPADVAELDKVFTQISCDRGFKVDLRCRALQSAPSLLLRALVLNRKMPNDLVRQVWRDLAAEQPPPDSAAIDTHGKQVSGADLLRNELARARRLDSHADAAEAIAAAVDAVAQALGQPRSLAGLGLIGTKPGVSTVPLSSYRSAQMLVSARLLHAEICSRCSTEAEVDHLVQRSVLPYAWDVPCLELLCWMLLVHAEPAAASVAAELRSLAEGTMSARLHHALLEIVLAREYEQHVWQLHPWLLAALCEGSFALCRAYCSHLVIETVGAVQRVRALLVLPRRGSALDEVRAIDPSLEERLPGLCRRWSQLLLRGGIVEAFCRQLLLELRDSCATDARSVVDAALFAQLPLAALRDGHGAAAAKRPRYG
ncbi:hypothetical protein T492DRAFT_230303 [Pavlovales sp. CCMP2436]|nr:hypothetical protein T492DRAFT_230303 [Pavlovales sp. CCMP2436]